MKEQKKVLVIASVASMIDLFNIPNLQLLNDMGYKVDVACNFLEGNTSSTERIHEFKLQLDEMNIDYYQIDFARNPFNFNKNLTAYNQVCDLMRGKNYQFAHCHSPIGGVIGRLAGKKTNTKIIYTAHGFHFYKGAPLINWLLFYPVERWLSRYTDTLITINKEDYNRAKTFKKTNAVYVPGVGIDLEKIKNINIDRDKKREKLGIPKESFLITSVGELNENKNHEIVIRALSQLENSDIHYVICGVGNLQDMLIKLSEDLRITNQVHLLGFRQDINEINKASDLFVFPSFREGLPVSVMEAMATGLPVVASDIRGNEDLIDVKGGYLIPPQNADTWAEKILSVYKLPILERLELGEYNEKKVEDYNSKNVLKHMMEIYKYA